VLDVAAVGTLRPMGLRFRRRPLSLGGPPHVMGIVNVNADSFYDRGASAGRDAAVARANELVGAGAALIDLGGMTAQPGPIEPAEVEAERVVSVLEALRPGIDVPIAVDTFRAPVADAALAAGADLVNDHSGLADPDMAAVVAAHDAGLVITHLGIPPKAEQAARYDVDPEAIAASLGERAARARAAGVRPDALLVDPGLGFGKSTATDLATLRRLPLLHELGYPILLACSHKEVTAEPLGLPESNLAGTAAVVAVAAYHGVDVLRLHDLLFMRHVATMGWLLRDGQAAGGERSGANSGTNRPSR
jgi:dihydropteroate synthase